MNSDSQKWLRIEEDNWTVIIPDFDSKPHSADTTKRKKKGLAWLNCPCEPTVQYLVQVIIHNSFIDLEKIEKSVNKLLK
jgi:hypothetical protein